MSEEQKLKKYNSLYYKENKIKIFRQRYNKNNIEKILSFQLFCDPSTGFVWGFSPQSNKIIHRWIVKRKTFIALCGFQYSYENNNINPVFVSSQRFEKIKCKSCQKIQEMMYKRFF